VRAPSLLVRLGTAVRPLEVVVPLPDAGRRELRRELSDALEQRCAVDDVVLADLADCVGLVIESTDEAGAAVARAVVLQLAALISPDELGLTVLTGDGRASAWRETAWLPHRASTGRPVHVVLADGAELHELAATIDQLGHDGVAVLWVTTPDGPRPSGAGALLQVDGPTATLELTSTEGTVERVESLAVDHLDPDEAHPLARSLAALAVAPELWLHRPGLPAPSHDRGLPTRVTLADLLASPDTLVDPIALAERWAGSGPDHLAAPIGVAQGGGVVNVDLVADGPHALVAGTTGAGKSELLRSWLLSAALHHPPDRLHLLLVDYKGGAAFGPLGALPHTVGTITDLTEQLARRALVSLRAEVRRREELIAAEGGDRWCGARLVVVVDEFATLAAELPEFVDGLVDLAQRGRSLGIHLVLATQRPAGVVTDAIRANTTMRLALRVADEDDSRDVVDTPAAARLPRDAPGRAVLRIGPSTAATVQVAWSGADVTRREPVVVQALRTEHPADRRVSAGSRPSDTPTQLDTAVATIRAAAELAGIATPRRPWLDPLPTSLLQADLPPAPRPGTAVVGLVDRPDAQRRDPLVVDLERDGGLVVVGTSGSGRSTVLRGLIAAVDLDTHDDWHTYVIDSGAALGDLTALASVGDVVGVDEAERVLRLLRTTVAELDRRASSGGRHDAPRWLLAVDGIGQLEERYERVDRGEALDLLARIARDGRSVGLHVAVTAQRRAEVPPALSGALGGRLLLRCATPDEAALWGLPDDMASPELPPGRCRIDGHVAQVAQVGADPHHRPALSHDRLPPPVPTLPTRLHLSHHDAASPDEWQVAVGRDGDTLRVVHLDLRHHHAIVAGPPRSGVSTALRTLAAHHRRATLLEGEVEPVEVVAAVDELLDAAGDGHVRLLLVDDLATLLDGQGGAEVEAALTRVVEAGRRLPVRLVVGGEVDAVSQCFHDVVAALRRGRTGLLLGGDPELHGALWHAQLRQFSDLPPSPGRGWLLGPGSASRVQVALP
jgi:S-DNA-T family DNA segregation ATPase FtsK/SpoIIIE